MSGNILKLTKPRVVPFIVLNLRAWHICEPHTCVNKGTTHVKQRGALPPLAEINLLSVFNRFRAVQENTICFGADLASNKQPGFERERERVSAVYEVAILNLANRIASAKVRAK